VHAGEEDYARLTAWMDNINTWTLTLTSVDKNLYSNLRPSISAVFRLFLAYLWLTHCGLCGVLDADAAAV